MYKKEVTIHNISIWLRMKNKKEKNQLQQEGTIVGQDNLKTNFLNSIRTYSDLQLQTISAWLKRKIVTYLNFRLKKIEF
jgi:hypothetical protein